MLKIFKRLWEVCEEMKKLKLVLRMCWIPGHAGIDYNEMVDKAAKDGVKMGREREEITVKIRNVCY